MIVGEVEGQLGAVVEIFQEQLQRRAVLAAVAGQTPPFFGGVVIDRAAGGGLQRADRIIRVLIRLIQAQRIFRRLTETQHGEITAGTKNVRRRAEVAGCVGFQRHPFVLVETFDAGGVGQVGLQVNHAHRDRQLLKVETGRDQTRLADRVDRVQGVQQQQRGLTPVQHLLADLDREFAVADEWQVGGGVGIQQA